MNIYEQRRQNLIDTMPVNSVTYFFSGDKVMRTADEVYPFFADRNYLYLTGIAEEGGVLKILKLEDKVVTTLFIRPYNELLAKWVGPRITKDAATELSAIESVLENTELFSDFMGTYELSRSFEDFTFYADLYRYEEVQDDKAPIKFIKRILEMLPFIKFKDIYPKMKSLRLIKHEDEIADTKKAIEITNEGILEMMKCIKPGVNERVLEATFNLTLAKYLSSNSFKSICASGERATVLHYSDNSHVVQDGELFLCDLGGTYNHYQADISRTFPVNGKFSERQKEVYEVVLSAQKMVEKLAKPGESLRSLQKAVVEFYKEQLPNIGLEKPVTTYYFHGVSHELGLDTHDFSDRNDVVLKPGMIISNEPGLYIEDEKIGIRIEDDLLITEDGCINLSSQIIREVADIEEFMKNNR